MNKVVKEGKTTKSYSFKVKECSYRDEIVSAINEYCKYKNNLNEIVKNNLVSTTIGEFVKNMPEKCHKESYYELATSDEFKNEPLYTLFTKRVDNNMSNNILYNSIVGGNLETYNGNSLGLTNTSYRRNGYYCELFSNYRVAIRKQNINVKRKVVNQDSSYDDLLEQTIFEYHKNKLFSVKDWNDKLLYLEGKSSIKPEVIERHKLLSDFFANHIDEVEKEYKLMIAKSVVEFGGCAVSENRKTMTVNNIDYTIKKKEGCNGFIITFRANKRDFYFDIFGRKDVIKDNEMLNDILNSHGKSITFILKGNDLYISLVTDVDFNKSESTFDNVVGIDINIKHAMISTSIKDDGTLAGYVNLYKEALNYSNFTKLLNKNELDYFEEQSKLVTICPIEFKMLASRIINNGYAEKEKQFSVVLDDLAKKFKANNELDKFHYVNNVIKFRAHIATYYRLKEVYIKKQSEYDIACGYVDLSTESKETMDKRRFENPFSETKQGIEIKEKMRNVSNDITGCRKNIVYYTYKLFNSANTTISLEELTSSQFDKIKRLPTKASMLKFHKLEGKTIEEAVNNENVGKIVNEYFNVKLDEDGKIYDIEYNEKGSNIAREALFFNTLIKSMGFATIKDDFILLSNNGLSSIITCPAFYSSQMDSVNHKIYTVKDEKGKTVVADKRMVRPTQEKHINGLNADYNSANNLIYIVINKDFRNCMLKKTKNKYNEPLMESRVLSQHKMLSELKGLNVYDDINTCNNEYVLANS